MLVSILHSVTVGERVILWVPLDSSVTPWPTSALSPFLFVCLIVCLFGWLSALLAGCPLCVSDPLGVSFVAFMVLGSVLSLSYILLSNYLYLSIGP